MSSLPQYIYNHLDNKKYNLDLVNIEIVRHPDLAKCHDPPT